MNEENDKANEMESKSLDEVCFDLSESGKGWKEVEAETGVKRPWLAAARWRKKVAGEAEALDSDGGTDGAAVACPEGSGAPAGVSEPEPMPVVGGDGKTRPATSGELDLASLLLEREKASGLRCELPAEMRFLLKGAGVDVSKRECVTVLYGMLGRNAKEE